MTRFAARLTDVGRWLGAAVLIAVYADVSAQDGLGRLFFTPEERRTLNEMRNDDVEPQAAAKPAQGETVAAPVVDVISFDGKVERSGGGSTIWVNGRPVLAGNRTIEGIGVHSSRGTSGETRFVLPPSDSGETDFSLKVGQKIAVQSGKVLDSYEARAAEDAQSVFATEPTTAPAASPDGNNSPKASGSSDKPAPSGGS